MISHMQYVSVALFPYVHFDRPGTLICVAGPIGHICRERGVDIFRLWIPDDGGDHGFERPVDYFERRHVDALARTARSLLGVGHEELEGRLRALYSHFPSRPSRGWRAGDRISCRVEDLVAAQLGARGDHHDNESVQALRGLTCWTLSNWPRSDIWPELDDVHIDRLLGLAQSAELLLAE